MCSCETLGHSTKPARASFSRAPLNLAIALYCRVIHVLEVLQELLHTVRVEGARELSLDTGHNSHTHSLDALVGPAQLILPFRLGYQRILPLFLLFNTPTSLLLLPLRLLIGRFPIPLH